jgi:hypothetical protein
VSHRALEENIFSMAQCLNRSMIQFFNFHPLFVETGVEVRYSFQKFRI